MAHILDRILDTKRAEVAAARALVPEAALRARIDMAPPPRGFTAALQRRRAEGKPAVIAEIKRASPSAGTFRGPLDPPFDPARFARAYEAAGAACLSVLTDREYFGGSLEDLAAARDATALPVLRKDFIVDAYQILEARAHGADAVLFILGTAPLDVFHEWEALAGRLGLDVLAESHDEAELMQALQLKTPLIGINNRDLTRFVTDVDTSIRLRPAIPAERLAIAESGVDSAEVAARLAAAGLDAYLIGGALMAQPDPGMALRALFPGRLP